MAQQMAAMQVEIDNKDQAALHQAEAAQEELHLVSGGPSKILLERSSHDAWGWRLCSAYSHNRNGIRDRLDASSQGKLAVCVISLKEISQSTLLMIGNVYQNG